jgi:hypothetical protein
VAEAPVHRTLAWLRDRRFDLAVVGGYVAITLVLTAPLWRNPNGVAVSANPADHTFFRFVLANAARSLTHLDNPLFSTVLNTPHGVNMMANTSILGLAIPMAPVTLTLGPSVAFVLLTMIVMAATAITWYLVLGRYVVTSRVAASVGAAFCAFGPGLMSQANGHPNLVAQFRVPVIVWRVARVPLSRNLLRDGIILGLVITYQAFINEEILFLTAQALAVCTSYTWPPGGRRHSPSGGPTSRDSLSRAA